VDVGVPGGKRGNVETRGEGDRVSTISLLGRSTSVALATGPTDEEKDTRNEEFCLWNLKEMAAGID